MSASQGNIFLTTENLAFSMPLILVCGGYAYLKYVPYHIGVPVLVGLLFIFQIRSQLRQQRAKKIQNMDEKALSDLALELEGEDQSAAESEEAKKKLAKKKAAIEYRLQVEQRKEAKRNKNKKKSDDDDDDIALDTFAKKNTKKRN